jgi:DNA gyrase/topoisomerase IV subunit B
MYIGSDDSQGLAHTVAELIDNASDEVMMGEASDIWLEIEKDQTVTVRDNGRGVPLGMSTTADGEKMPTPQMLFTKMHAGGKFGPSGVAGETTGSGYDASGGLHGVGGKCANFLSRVFRIQIWRDGQHYAQEFRDGGLQIDPPIIKPLKGNQHGTEVSFLFDPEPFTVDTHVDAERLVTKLKSTAYSLPGARLHFTDARTGVKETFVHPDGIGDLVRDLASGADARAIFRDVLRIKRRVEIPIGDERNWKKGQISVYELDVAMLPTDSTDPNDDHRSFVNTIPTAEGGDHLSGARTGLARAVKRYMTEQGLTKAPDQLDSRDILMGLELAVSVRMTVPKFSSQAKAKLNVGEVNALTAGLVDEFMRDWLIAHEREAKPWAKSIEENREARLELIKIKKNISAARRDKIDTRLAKLAGIPTECPPEKAELFLVEGDSAGGSATQGRDGKFQAVLPFRGVSKNVLGVKVSEILNNVELATLGAAIGLEYRSEYDERDLRYHKIILMADADPDGGHINLLWLTIFYAEFRGLLFCAEHGSHLYLANPPLYWVENTRDRNHVKTYLRDQVALDRFLKGKTRADYKWQRFKGLGEMNKDQLWETVLDPANRNLQRIGLGGDHAMLLSIMGKGKDAAQYRKEYLRHLGPVSDAEDLPEGD